MRQDVTKEIDRDSDDLELQELHCLLRKEKNWRSIDSEWLLAYPISLMSIEIFLYLFPAILKLPLTDERFGYESMISLLDQITVLPKNGQQFERRIKIDIYSNVQKKVIFDSLSYLLFESDEIGNQRVKQMEFAISCFALSRQDLGAGGPGGHSMKIKGN